MAALTEKYRPYPAYKPTEVEWLEEIPIHWEVSRLKHLGDLQGGAGFPHEEQWDTTQEYPFFKVGDMGVNANQRDMVEYQHTVSLDTAKRLGAHVFPPFTIVFAKVGAALKLNRRRMIVRLSCIDNNMMGLIPHKPDPGWMMYWLNELDLGKLANPGAVPSVNEGQMRDQEVIVPPLSEQRAIASFLDRETAKIDALVSKKERLVELLREKRTALISHAVTKGLDPTAPMKDSGVEWLGEIPTYWEVKRLKYLADFINGAAFNPAEWGTEGTPIIRIQNLNGGDDFNYTTRKLPTKYISQEGELLFGWSGNRGTSFGPFLWSRKGEYYVNQHIFRVLPRHVTKEWFYWTLKAVTFHVERQAHGIIGMVHITRDELGAIYIPTITDVSQQHAIAEFLDRETAKLDDLLAKVHEAIERLRELRTALISAAVTGRIDVREEAG